MDGAEVEDELTGGFDRESEEGFDTRLEEDFEAI